MGYKTNKRKKHLPQEVEAFWFIIGTVIQIITLFVIIRDLPKGMGHYALLPLGSALVSSLLNGFIHQCKLVAARTFFAISGLALTYYVLGKWFLASLFDLI
jgi:hypothetical protein